MNIDVTRGQVALDGAVQLRQAPTATAADRAGLSGGFTGQVTVGDFHAVDKLNSADFLKWKSLYLAKLDVRLNPDSVSIGEVALADLFARVIINREGKLNLLQRGDVVMRVMRRRRERPPTSAREILERAREGGAEGLARLAEAIGIVTASE